MMKRGVKVLILILLEVSLIHCRVIKENYENKTIVNKGGRIVGGLEVDITFVPHQVLLISYFKEFSGLCGGSIISESFVLTAAHSVLGAESYSVR